MKPNSMSAAGGAAIVSRTALICASTGTSRQVPVTHVRIDQSNSLPGIGRCLLSSKSGVWFTFASLITAPDPTGGYQSLTANENVSQ